MLTTIHIPPIPGIFDNGKFSVVGTHLTTMNEFMISYVFWWRQGAASEVHIPLHCFTGAERAQIERECVIACNEKEWEKSQ